MKDGTIFAGVSYGKYMFVTPKDAPGGPKKWENAMKYAANLNAHGHTDWKLPSEAELAELFNNRARIGGFDTGQRKTKRVHYYASTREDEGDWYGNDPNDKVLVQSFKDGTKRWISREENVFRARPVRLESRPTYGYHD